VCGERWWSGGRSGRRDGLALVVGESGGGGRRWGRDEVRCDAAARSEGCRLAPLGAGDASTAAGCSAACAAQGLARPAGTAVPRPRRSGGTRPVCACHAARPDSAPARGGSPKAAAARTHSSHAGRVSICRGTRSPHLRPEPSSAHSSPHAARTPLCASASWLAAAILARAERGREEEPCDRRVGCTCAADAGGLTQWALPTLARCLLCRGRQAACLTQRHVRGASLGGGFLSSRAPAPLCRASTPPSCSRQRRSSVSSSSPFATPLVIISQQAGAGRSSRPRAGAQSRAPLEGADARSARRTTHVLGTQLLPRTAHARISQRLARVLGLCVSLHRTVHHVHASSAAAKHCPTPTVLEACVRC
jgi:hypothetical protein